jgi:hypothetical protein
MIEKYLIIFHALGLDGAAFRWLMVSTRSPAAPPKGTTMKTRIAKVRNPWTSYGNEPQAVRISRSKARAAGAEGVQFYAPGWRPMVFRSMEAAERKIESHPGFIEWVR